MTGVADGSIKLTGYDSDGNPREVLLDIVDGAALVSDGALSFRKDNTTSATYTYFGEAPPGSATSAAVWRISRMTNSDSTILWADGNGNFDNVWDNRASLSYS